jgi:hypothetical protein
MPSRPNRISASCKRFAGREPLTVAKAFAGPRRGARRKLTNSQSLACKSIDLLGEIAVFDALVFEFMGLAILALCVIVLLVPAQRRPTRHIRDA